MNLYRFKNKAITLFCCSMLTQATLLAQTNPTVTIHKSGIPLKEALQEVEKQTKMSVAYNESQLKTNRQMSLDIQNQSVEKALDAILKGTGFTYRISDGYIMIIPVAEGKQDRERVKISGQVVDEQNYPLIGVNVAVVGKSGVGAISDFDGNFTLDVQTGDVLSVSYIGYASQEIQVVPGKNAYMITLLPDTETLDEVVVTALGIKRSTKALTYNVQELKSDNITGIKDASFVNSLTGKVAGVTINQSANGLGGSTRVVMRGAKSLFGDNNALYVVDGIPLASMRSEQPQGSFEMPDGGDSDGISSINPEDIESMSILTGAAAAALYGSSGANGVILITTKKGSEGKLKVSYSNNTQFLSPFVLPDFQNTYGRKNDKVYESWGNKLSTPSSYDPADFFQTGFTETNSLSLTAGNERNQTYFSASSMNAAGIVPNSEFNRYNFTLRNTTELIKDRLTLDMGASYVLQNNHNLFAQGEAHNPLLPLYLFPPSDDIEKYKTYEHYNAERNFPTQFWPYKEQALSMQNPWWIANREHFENDKLRYMFTANLSWKINSWIRATGRLRVDNSDDTYTRKISASSSTLFASDYGNYMKMITRYKNFYADAIVNFDKRFYNDLIGLNANVGASVVDDVSGERTGYEGHLLRVPNLFTFENIIPNDPETNPIESKGIHTNTQSVFATLQLSYKSSFFLDVSGRNDWASTFAFTSHRKKGFFYPSVGLSFVPTEMFDWSDTPLSFMKVRASYSEVGNAPIPYVTSLSYGIDGGNIGSLPFVPATFLEPERTKAFEVGMNVRLFENKINLDVTYYNSNTYNQFFTISMPPSSGYSHFYANGGRVNNWGIEAMLSYNQDLGPVDWTSTVTFSMNRNEIKELLDENTVNPITGEKIEPMPYIDVVTNDSYKQRLVKGGSIGDIYVTGLKTDHQGNVYVNPQNGAIEADSETWLYAGNAAPDYNLGWNNTFSYKGFTLGVLVDARIGGVCVSATQALMDRFGTSQASADARDNGGAILNGGKVNPESYYSVVGGGKTGLLAYYTYSATNVRLREASLGYTFPDKWFKGVLDNVTLSVIGKNLFMFYNKAPFDPEVASSTSTYYQGIDYFMLPSLRNVGFSLKVNF